MAENDDLRAEQLQFLRQIAQLIRGANRLTIAAQKLPIELPWSKQAAHNLWRCLPSVGRCDYSLQCFVAARLDDQDAVHECELRATARQRLTAGSQK